MLNDQIAALQADVRHSQALIAEYEAANRGMLSDSTQQTSLFSASSSDVKVDRFSKIVLPVADAMIESRGEAVPFEEIYDALPADARAALEARASREDNLFRIRRTVRRNKKYVVTEDGMAFASMVPPPVVQERSIVTRLLRRRDGSIARIELLDQDGRVSQSSPAQVREALRAGRKILVPGPGDRQSTLRLAGGRFYSEIDGTENDDFFELPEGSAEAERDDF